MFQMVTENMDQFSDKQRLTLSRPEGCAIHTSAYLPTYHTYTHHTHMRPVARAGNLERAEAR
jgi:hypothetical protein